MTFLRSILRKPVSAIVFLVLYSVVFLGFLNQSQIQSYLVQKFSVEKQDEISLKLVYWDNKTKDKVYNLSKKIPGIKKILADKKRENNLLLKTKKNRSLNIGEVGSLKLILDPLISLESAKMIRSFFKERFSSSELMPSSVKFPLNQKGQAFDKVFNLSLKYLYILYMVLSLCTLFSYYLMTLHLSHYSFIIEEFQRKKFVFYKAAVSGLTFMSVILILIQKYFFELNIIRFFVAFIVILLVLSLLSVNLYMNKAYEKIQ